MCVDHTAMTKTETGWEPLKAAAYVAYSRVTDIANLQLVSPLRAEQARADPEVIRHFGDGRDITR